MAETDKSERVTEEFDQDAVDNIGGVRSIHTLIRALKWVSGTLMFTLMLVTFIDVMGRYGFNRPLPGGFEIIEFNLGLLIFSALPLVTHERKHITVSLFDSFMSDRMLHFRESVVLIGSVGVVIFIAYLMAVSGIDFHQSGTVSRYMDFPMAPVVFMISTLSLATIIILLAMIFHHVRSGVAGSAET